MQSIPSSSRSDKNYLRPAVLVVSVANIVCSIDPAFASDCKSAHSCAFLSFLGAVLLIATTAMVITDHFFDPGTKLNADLSVSVRIQFLSPRTSSPMWYWITNGVLSLLSWAFICLGLVFEQPYDCPVGSKHDAFAELAVHGPQLAAYILLCLGAGLMWVPLLSLARMTVEPFLWSRTRPEGFRLEDGEIVPLTDELLMDTLRLREYLGRYEDRPGYEALCERAVRLGAQLRERRRH